MPAASRV